MSELREGQMSFPIKTRRIEKPRRPVTRRVRFTPAIENPTTVIPKPDGNSEQNSLTNNENPVQVKKFQFGQGSPDELGRTNEDSEYGIPAAFYSTRESKADAPSKDHPGLKSAEKTDRWGRPSSDILHGFPPELCTDKELKDYKRRLRRRLGSRRTPGLNSDDDIPF